MSETRSEDAYVKALERVVALAKLWQQARSAACAAPLGNGDVWVTLSVWENDLSQEVQGLPPDILDRALLSAAHDETLHLGAENGLKVLTQNRD